MMSLYMPARIPEHTWAAIDELLASAWAKGVQLVRLDIGFFNWRDLERSARAIAAAHSMGEPTFHRSFNGVPIRIVSFVDYVVLWGRYHDGVRPVPREKERR